TGKSEIIKAMLWHAYQHDMCELIGLAAYTWKAGRLISSKHNQSYSTTCLFGTPTGRQRKTNLRKALSRITPKTRLFTIDEASFNSLEHNRVSLCKQISNSKL
ncbi:MAG: hypothetical protein ACK5PF_10935, partial [bacterium]